MRRGREGWANTLKLFASTYNKFIEIVEDTIAAIRPGATAAHVFSSARETHSVRELQFGPYDMFGHGLGLETHEEPVLNSTNKIVLQENMVLNVEFALRFGKEIMAYEDTIVVTSDGTRPLSGLQKELPSIC